MAERLVDELEKLFAPLESAADDEFQREQLFEALHGDLDELSEAEATDLADALGAVVDSFGALSDLVEGSPSSMDLVAILGETADVFLAVEEIESTLSGTPLGGVAGALVDYLVMTYLSAEHPALLQMAFFLTVLKIPTADGDQQPPPIDSPFFVQTLPERAEFQPAVLGELLSDPIETITDYYLPDGEVTPEALEVLGGYAMRQFQTAFGKLGFDCSVDMVSAQVDDVPDYPHLTVGSQSLSATVEFEDDAMFGLDVLLGVNDGRLTLLLSPWGAAAVDFETGAWELSLNVTGEFDIILVDSDGFTAETDDGESEVGIEGGIHRVGSSDSDGSGVTRIGPPDGTRLEVARLGLDAGVTGDPTGGDFDLDVLASVDDANITVSPGDGDSFIKHVLPEDGVSVDFDAGLGWSRERGLYFEGGGAGLETDLPIGLDIGGVLRVDTLQLSAVPDTSGETVKIPVHVAADPQVSLGPFDAVVEGIGLEADLAFPENSDGNLGPVDVQFGFKPPTGTGLSIDAGAVVGGGYLSFDPENERYSGVLQLRIGDLTLTAIGLLTTKLPGGRDGFSLLVVITGEFPPVQLGFGFTLNGVGGLVGANRTMDVNVLRGGVKDGTTRSLLFPEDPVRNATQIVSDLRNAFPPAAGAHVFGPMARLGWGTPTIVTADIGVLLEVPDPMRVVILGRIQAALPHEDHAMVEINMDAIGVVDFGEETASVDATLYDSRVLAYTLTGDMAMRSSWGADPDFALAVGGFNPRYDPPEDFPSLDRVALTLGSGNPEIRWEGYFALTSNTVQVGSKVELYARASGFAFDGKLGFDTLFRFDPFEMVADFYAGFALKKGGSTLMSVDLDGTLKGPGPWNVSGKASFEIWPISFDVSFDQSFGQSESQNALPAADVLDEVASALGDERNWSAQRPAGGNSVVTLRQVEREEGSVLAHPLGGIGVRQQVAPLGIRIETFGNATPDTYDRFTVTEVLVEGESQLGDATRERFARGEYLDLSDDERLDGPAFAEWEAGHDLANDLFAWGGMDEDADEDDSDLAVEDLAYETVVIDSAAQPDPLYIGRIGLPQSTAKSLSAVSAVAKGDLRTTGDAKYAARGGETGPTGVQASVSVSDASYVVVGADDLSPVDVGDESAERPTKREAEEALVDWLRDGDLDGTADDYRVVASHEAASQEVPA